MEKDHVQFFNPANAANVNAEDFAGFGELTTDQINDLAKAYPNKGGSGYLVLRDKTKKDKDQLFPVSSWGNLANLHKMGQTQFEAAGFKANFKRINTTPAKQAPVQDLTNKAAKNELKSVSGGKVEESEETTGGEGDFKELSVPAGDGKPKEAAQKTVAPKKAAAKAAAKKGKK